MFMKGSLCNCINIIYYVLTLWCLFGKVPYILIVLSEAIQLWLWSVDESSLTVMLLLKCPWSFTSKVCSFSSAWYWSSFKCWYSLATCSCNCFIPVIFSIWWLNDYLLPYLHVIQDDYVRLVPVQHSLSVQPYPPLIVYKEWQERENNLYFFSHTFLYYS